MVKQVDLTGHTQRVLQIAIQSRKSPNHHPQINLNDIFYHPNYETQPQDAIYYYPTEVRLIRDSMTMSHREHFVTFYETLKTIHIREWAKKSGLVPETNSSSANSSVNPTPVFKNLSGISRKSWLLSLVKFLVKLDDPKDSHVNKLKGRFYQSDKNW
jgi:hypothetical protein